MSPANEMSRRKFIATGAVLVLAVGTGVGVRTAFVGPEADKARMRMGEGAMKVLVVYGTKSGCTEGIAKRIGDDLASKDVTVDVVPAENAGDPSGYDAVIVGSGIRAGSWHASAKTWVESNAAALKELPVAFYTCGLMITNDGKESEVRGYTDPLIEATGVRPIELGLFAGWNNPQAFSFAERTMMKLMKAPQGDFRDWAAIDAWTDTVAARIQA